MSWAKFDDHYDDHPKVTAATERNPRAALLHAHSITACSRWVTDGVIDQRWLRAQVPNANQRKAVVKVLVDLRLFDVLAAGEITDVVDKNGYEVTIGPFAESRLLVHDYLEYNPSSEQVRAKRERDASRKRGERDHEREGSKAGKQGSSKPNGAKRPRGQASESNGTPNGRRAASGGPVPVPGVSNETPSENGGGEGGERADVERVCELLAERMEANGVKRIGWPSEGWRTAARRMFDIDGREVDEAERLINWCQSDGFWRSNVMSMPTFRDQYDRLRLKAQEKGGLPSAPAVIPIDRGHERLREAQTE